MGFAQHDDKGFHNTDRQALLVILMSVFSRHSDERSEEESRFYCSFTMLCKELNMIMRFVYERKNTCIKKGNNKTQ